MKQESQGPDYIQIACKVFQERLEEAFRSAPQKENSYLQKKDFQQILLKLQEIRNKGIETQKFAAILFIQASKCFETYGKNQDGQLRFPFSKYIHNQISEDLAFFNSLFSIRVFLKNAISFKPFHLNHILEKAIQCIKKNLDTVNLILNKNITMMELEKFLNDQEVLIFIQDGYGLENVIQGLSSVNGKIVYISNALIIEYETLKKYENDEDNLNSSVDSNNYDLSYNLARKIQWAIELHMIENISKYFSDQIDYRSISPERNPNLRVYDDHMVGSGRFFLKKVHNRKCNQQNQLGLNILESLNKGRFF